MRLIAYSVVIDFFNTEHPSCLSGVAIPYMAPR